MGRFAYRVYRRPFQRSLQTHHGRWDVREGLLVRLSVGDRQGYGEIAPLPWFGGETQAQAIGLCRSLPPDLSLAQIHAIPDRYPACQFGLESAWDRLHHPRPDSRPRASAHLLPTGAEALGAWSTPWHQGCRTFKWKIGAAPLAQELDLFEQLLAALPTEATLRLDANGGLTQSDAQIWLDRCDRLGPQTAVIDCLEQPLPPEQFPQLLTLQQRYHTAIALDESVATVAQLEHCLQHGWQGVVVIKGAIAGSPSRLRQVCQRYQADVIWSSVFETAVARRYIFSHLIPTVPSSRPLGFGVAHWFADGLNSGDASQIWSRL
ncbi:MAG: o-succinylbenzoate synthase [Elainellaceae cyanobacterium]